MNANAGPLKFESLEKKGLNISIGVLNLEEWQKLTRADPSIPRSFVQLSDLVQATFDAGKRLEAKALPEKVVDRGLITRGIEECGEALYYMIYAGLRNPWLTSAQRTMIEKIIYADTPAFDKSIQTDHFVLKWTDKSSNEKDNITERDIIVETGNYLEDAWAKYNNVFDRAPYLAPDKTKIDVIFHDINGFGVTTPHGPIELDASSWIEQPGIRQPTSAHELFHRLQYSFGYRTKWSPSDQYRWFSEGTASWSEVFVWKRVSSEYKLKDLFGKPDLDLYEASYRLLPFWIFFQTRQQDYPTDNPLVSFFNKYDAIGDAEKALKEVINENWPPNDIYGELDNFFALFSRERLLGNWHDTPHGGQPYETILDPYGNDIEPYLKVTDITLGHQDSYEVQGTVSGLGSDYFRFKFEPDSEGKVINILSKGAASGDYSYYMVWEKDGKCCKAAFPFSVVGSYGYSETINIKNADSLALIISGRGIGGFYKLDVWIR
jgi:hypothetical protein